MYTESSRHPTRKGVTVFLLLSGFLCISFYTFYHLVGDEWNMVDLGCLSTVKNLFRPSSHSDVFYKQVSSLRM